MALKRSSTLSLRIGRCCSAAIPYLSIAPVFQPTLLFRSEDIYNWYAYRDDGRGRWRSGAIDSISTLYSGYSLRAGRAKNIADIVWYCTCRIITATICIAACTNSPAMRLRGHCGIESLPPARHPSSLLHYSRAASSSISLRWWAQFFDDRRCRLCFVVQ